MSRADYQLPPTFAIAAIESLREKILRGELLPGARINQGALAQELGISLVPLREALRKLAAEGLIHILPHHGAFLRAISRSELIDLYSIRGVLEGMATRSSATKLTRDNLTTLVSIVSEMERETARMKDFAGLLRLNREFHFSIYRVSGREFLCETIVGLWDKSTLYRSLYVNLPGRSVQALQEHREILRALQNHQVKEAVRLVRNNIRQTMIGLLATLKNGQVLEK